MKNLVIILIVSALIFFIIFFLLQKPDKTFCKGSALCFSGKVDYVIDGDTLSVNGSVIRLALVDAPEKDEHGYESSKLFTQKLCDSEAIVDQDDVQLYDKYGRMVAVVFCQNKSLNAELLRNNLAVISTVFCSKSEFGSEEWARNYGC